MLKTHRLPLRHQTRSLFHYLGKKIQIAIIFVLQVRTTLPDRILCQRLKLCMHLFVRKIFKGTKTYQTGTDMKDDRAFLPPFPTHTLICSNECKCLCRLNAQTIYRFIHEIFADRWAKHRSPIAWTRVFGHTCRPQVREHNVQIDILRSTWQKAWSLLA